LLPEELEHRGAKFLLPWQRHRDSPS
jgi:hypothetical protein